MPGARVTDTLLAGYAMGEVPDKVIVKSLRDVIKLFNG